jgi:hypothetical protein
LSLPSEDDDASESNSDVALANVGQVGDVAGEATSAVVRVVREGKLFEFDPVTFPAYEGATAGVHRTPGA